MNNDPQLYDKSNGLQKKDSEYLLKRLEKDFKNVSPKVIVDIGCGTGNITQMIYSSFPDSRIIGFDCSEKMIEFAREKYSTSNLNFNCGNICAEWEELSVNLDIEAESVDVVTSTFCLHWVTNTAKAMENINKMLKPGGKCYLLMFSWSSILPLQEQITYQEPWYELFRKLEVPKHNEKPKYATNYQSDKSIESELTRQASTSQLADSQHLLDLAKPKSKSLTIRRRSSAPFPVYEIPPEKERIDHWIKLCETANLKPIEVAIHDSTFTYEDIEGFKGELVSLCHFLAHVPKDLHSQFLNDYFEHMNRCFIAHQNTLPKINVDYQFLTAIAEKPATTDTKNKINKDENQNEYETEI
ncbi:juvenile hormone acid O-methyltransferase-like [Tetranychus urticae]|uniref:juvenile hormone acid O-methyltransferase-like n=1 Tax=Tetranychus urticae TaxID=32264 RepID=UPI00077B9EA8|nr:juvenile hormone acid O-methyltransferase-like [Tetranychus urticae]